MAAALFDELIAAFDSDPLIDEIDVVMSPAPPAAVVVEHKLGISAKAMKPIFAYALPKFFEVLAEAKSSESAFVRLWPSALMLTKAILMIKGDIAQALNFRKDLVSRGLLTCENELKFIGLIFSRHPKCPSGWQHRRWCLNRLEMSGEQIEVERELCRLMADKFPKNYYAWNHRIWLLSFMDMNQVSFLNTCKLFGVN
jgi:protein prenyltransferase alpha subunit repeat containing protein 1